MADRAFSNPGRHPTPAVAAAGRLARRLPPLAGAVALLWSLAGCGYYHHAGPLRPLGEQDPAMQAAGDGGVAYVRGGFAVTLRPVTDHELNRQFAAHSGAGIRSTNPYTFGNTRFWEGERQRSRFTVFHLRVTNGEYPKVKIDPAHVVLRADNGREYWSLGLAQLDSYFRAYATGYQGNEYARYRERLDLLNRTLFRNQEVFRGQEAEGFLVFPLLDPDVRQLQAVIRDAVIRFDFRNEPVEVVALTYRFGREVGRIYPDGRVE